jgi:hypothetical protein
LFLKRLIPEEVALLPCQGLAGQDLFLTNHTQTGVVELSQAGVLGIHFHQ